MNSRRRKRTMNRLKRIGGLPKPIKFLAKSFYIMDPHSPEIYEARPEEMESLRRDENVVFQLILDRTWFRWYLVAVGDQERLVRSDLIYHDPFKIKRSILVFAEVNDAWIRAKRREYEKAMISRQTQVWDDESQQFHPEDFALEDLDRVKEQYG